MQKNKDKRILLVDDDPESLRLMEATLSWEGYSVEATRSGQVAIDKMCLWCPHLVLLDINMPGLNGIETLKFLRANTEHVSTIFVSGESDTEAVIRGLDAGSDDYICKPFNPMELLARVRAQLRVKVLHDELQQANLKLKGLVDIDDLTGLFNMRSLYDKLDHEIERVHRYGGSISAVMMDLDHFKKVNDNNDHLFGSYVLAQVGKVLRENMRKIDFAARYGGDEFLVVVSQTDLRGSLSFAERVRSVIESTTFTYDEYSIKLTASLGLAVTNKGGGGNVDARTLVKYADKALYQAKNSGRNCVRYHQFVEQESHSGSTSEMMLDS